MLTRILQLSPGDDALKYSNRVLTALPLLSSDLKRPSRLSRLILPSQSSFTLLCPLHKPLDASLVHTLFQLLVLEVGIRLNILVSNNDRLTPEQWSRVESVRQLHALWLDPETYERTFLASASESKHAYQGDSCEGCTLSRMAGDLDTLLNLRMLLLCRQHTRRVKKHGPSQFLRWIQAWIASLATQLIRTGHFNFEEMIAKNDKDAKQLKKVRRQIWHEKREKQWKNKRRSPNSIGTSTHNETEEGPSDHNAEISIIDHYAALLSTPHLPSVLISRTSLISPKTRQPCQPLQPISLSPTPSSAYSQSMPLLVTGDPIPE
jgi:hypothetical protein